MPAILITTAHPASRHGVPVVLIDGEPASDREGLKAALKALGWSMRKAAQETGKTVAAFDQYRAERAPVPAEVWNRLRDALEQREGEES